MLVVVPTYECSRVFMFFSQQTCSIHHIYIFIQVHVSLNLFNFQV